jgi:homoserine O-succinyltransferase
MPLVAHNDLPSFQRLSQEGQTILDPYRARHQDIRELHIGLLNMMPDAALGATERQFLRLVGESNPIAQFYVHPFTLEELERGPRGCAHVQRYYETFDRVRVEGLDALIITGANVTHPHLSQEPFWGPLKRVIDWAYENVTSTLCSCLATHAVLESCYGQQRRAQKTKQWGVFRHQVTDRHHPLVNDVNTLFDVPHSRWNDVSRAQFEDSGLWVLAESDQVGVHLAVSGDGFRLVFFQGHPEYDTISLLKEYKREVLRFGRGEISTYPPIPWNYFAARERAILEEYRERLETARSGGQALPEFPEDLVAERLHNTWHDTAEAIVGNWMGLVYQTTHHERRIPFMDGVDPDDPLGLGRSARPRVDGG